VCSVYTSHRTGILVHARIPALRPGTYLLKCCVIGGQATALPSSLAVAGERPDRRTAAVTCSGRQSAGEVGLHWSGYLRSGSRGLHSEKMSVFVHLIRYAFYFHGCAFVGLSYQGLCYKLVFSCELSCCCHQFLFSFLFGVPRIHSFCAICCLFRF